MAIFFKMDQIQRSGSRRTQSLWPTTESDHYPFKGERVTMQARTERVVGRPSLTSGTSPRVADVVVSMTVRGPVFARGTVGGLSVALRAFLGLIAYGLKILLPLLPPQGGYKPMYLASPQPLLRSRYPPTIPNSPPQLTKLACQVVNYKPW
ncbi:hypothetical protein CSW21_00795 [Thermus scotoductus]|uniref:Uncharacterized protein n=2 Tax=Thermus scotoductus TaxID=37636 RepID=A0A430RGD0_THESC|nr:hypothetical protein CSW49_00815 [Thermus scotoductus]RTH07073.1 hypothetical protein CSW45_00905 [Thermus scotoductus]RTH23667.1 hypothetical protein CSW42_00440 [Thermus scotoductus]RTI03238.1 hypothetical protein CSW28_00405 [Thermus scotoductus]RTI25190.1 hypothetical protein CSW21_00795 [Thermus scotoductus]